MNARKEKKVRTGAGKPEPGKAEPLSEAALDGISAGAGGAGLRPEENLAASQPDAASLSKALGKVKRVNYV